MQVYKLELPEEVCTSLAMAKIAIIVYSTYGHLYSLAKAVKSGVESSGLSADLFVVPETLGPDVLEKMHAAPVDPEFKEASIEVLEQYDAFLFGVPTRFGNMPAQWADFWGKTGGLWANGALYHKLAGVFVSTGTPGGGQEVTVRNYMSIIAHHGMIFVPLGYGKAFAQITSLEEVHGASPWGAGMYAGGDGSRQASDLELEIAKIQGTEFASVVKGKFGKAEATPKAEAAAEAAAEPTSNAETSKARKAQTTQEKDEKAKSGCAKCIVM